jgi:hypothetical protein
VRSTAAPYTESRLTHLVRNKCVGFPVVEQLCIYKKKSKLLFRCTLYNIEPVQMEQKELMHKMHNYALIDSRCSSVILVLRRWTWTGDFKCREVKTGFGRNRSMQTGSSGTLIGWKSGQTTFVPLWDGMEGAWLRTQKLRFPGAVSKCCDPSFESWLSEHCVLQVYLCAVQYSRGYKNRAILKKMFEISPIFYDSLECQLSMIMTFIYSKNHLSCMLGTFLCQSGHMGRHRRPWRHTFFFLQNFFTWCLVKILTNTLKNFWWLIKWGLWSGKRGSIKNFNCGPPRTARATPWRALLLRQRLSQKHHPWEKKQPGLPATIKSYSLKGLDRICVKKWGLLY